MIRKAMPEDKTDAAVLLFSTAESIYRYVYFEETEKTLEIMEKMFLLPMNECSLDFCWIAEVDGRPAGLLQIYNAAEGKKIQRGTGRAMSKTMGFFTALRRIPRGMAIGRVMLPIPDDMLYIGHLAVHPANQGQGIGSRLLEFAAKHAQERGLARVGLDVEVGNDRAHAVYLRNGYTDTSTLTSKKMQRDMGFAGFTRMEKKNLS